MLTAQKIKKINHHMNIKNCVAVKFNDMYGAVSIYRYQKYTIQKYIKTYIHIQITSHPSGTLSTDS